MMVIARDITERRETENLLKESEANARAIMESTDDVLMLLDKDGIVIDCNEAHAKRLNTTRLELLGKNVFERLPKDVAESRKAIVNEVIASGKPVSSEDLRGGYWNEFVIHPIIIENKITDRVAIFARDITEHKKAEAEILKSKQQYDNLVAQIPVGVYVLRTKPDYTFDLEYVSPVMAEILGLSVESLLAYNETIFKAIHPDDLEEVARLNLEGIKQKQPFDWKGRAVVKGVVKWLHISSLPQLQEDGDILWHGLVVDITERMRDEAEIRLKNEELQNLNATKDKFFSIIAHDLRSPFNSILGLTNYMVEQIQEKNFEKLEEYGVIVRNSSQRAMDLLTNLLEWSRSQTGRMEFSPEYIEMGSLIGEVTSLLVDSAEQKSITISQKTSGEIVASVDRSMFSTIMRNLISNAIKFTKVGGAIEISLEDELSAFKVSVKDNGIGIKKGQIEKLFRIDENQSTLGTRNEKGTGLGLILCKEFVDKHGGLIWVESEVGKGSLFCFTIPKH